uniref:K Homology domain-containing protein n=1 Tax=Romanomermis culicivorax TaxID=13658 RepID=A0A915KBY2_ROMCU
MMQARCVPQVERWALKGNFTSGSVLPNGIPVSVPVITAAAPGAVLVDSQGNTFVATTAAAPPTPSGVVIDPQQQAPPPQMMIDTYSNLYAASTTFAVAPGAEHSAHKLQQQQNMSSTTPAAVTTTNNGHQHHAMDSQSQKKIVMDYESDFPTLAPIDNQNVPSSSASTWSNQNAKPMMSVKSTTVTQVFHFPADERRHLNMSDQGFGDKSQEQDECNNISLKTGTSIDLCQNKDSSLTIVVSGKRANVEEARKWIVQSLQTQCHREIRIPKDHYKILIGREGKNLQALEKETDCRIMIPNRDTPSEMIKIIGPKEGIEKAIHKIQLISDEQSKLAQEHLTIPKVFYPFIRGPYNEIIDQITHETGARVNIPPSTAASEIIVVTGEKEGVHRAVAVIKKIYEEKKNSQTVAVQIDKKQHKFIIGHQRSGLAEILKETGVSVEVPPEDSNSNEITLRGDGTKLGAALALVYTKASSILPATIECPSWLHRYIIGPKGSGIRAIVGEDENGGKSQVQVSFEEGQIFLEGPAAETKRVRDDLTKIVKDLQAEYTFEILHIDQNFHRHVIGRSGSNISKIRQETGVNISIPADDSNSDEIRIDGKKTGVAQAKAEIMELVKKMENEKSRDIVIENRFHRLIIGTKGESIRELRDKFPGVNVQFPEPGRKTDIVSLRGPKEEVDKCHKHLQNLTKELKENNYQERIQIFKEFHPHIIGKGGVNIKKLFLLQDT